ncbi:MAG: hypothetical protein ACE15F_08525 [bacterium]
MEIESEWNEKPQKREKMIRIMSGILACHRYILAILHRLSWMRVWM